MPVPASLDTGSKQPVGTPTGPAVSPGSTIAYDAVGNIVRNGGTSYAVGSADRITTQAGPAGSWTYDRSGAVTTMTSPKGDKPSRMTLPVACRRPRCSPVRTGDHGHLWV